MRKRLTGAAPRPPRDTSPPDGWLDLESLARVEVSSEEAASPIEAALVPGSETGWRAEQSGEQTVRLIFDRPQHLRRIALLFVEPAIARTQEVVLRWSPDNGRSFQEIVRQQWNFSPSGSMQEVEDYRVDLLGVTMLDLRIIPDVSGGPGRASLAQLRLG